MTYKTNEQISNPGKSGKAKPITIVLLIDGSESVVETASCSILRATLHAPAVVAVTGSGKRLGFHNITACCDVNYRMDSGDHFTLSPNWIEPAVGSMNDRIVSFRWLISGNLSIRNKMEDSTISSPDIYQLSTASHGTDSPTKFVNFSRIDTDNKGRSVFSTGFA